ncbi:MAG: Dabb family protein [Planctomycetota bacterium]|nr:MAG: Dabb family protein [Planctomycetota bacterium]
MLAHSVFFRLKDRSQASIDRLVDGCREHLAGHPGEVLFAVGTASVYDRQVNDRDWQVALHIVFDSHASHDSYQQALRHELFIAAHAETWAQVRIFDADLSVCDASPRQR